MAGARTRAGWVLAGIYLLAALPVNFVFVAHPGLAGHPDADFGQMIKGTASRPYVTRALVPFLVRSTVACIPDASRIVVADHMRGRRMVELFGWEDPWLIYYAVATAWFVACFVGFAFVLRRLAAAVYGMSGALRDLSPLVAFAVLPLCFRYYSYLYDPATLLLFSLGVLLIIEKRTVPFLLALALASANKETSVLLVALYAWRRAESGEGRVWLHAVVALLVWLAVHLTLGIAFHDRPGAMVETHGDHTVWLFTEFPGRFWYALGVVALLAAAVLPGWRAKPRFLRAGLLITALPLFVAALFLGFADELRGYYETAPFVFLLSLPTLARVCGEEISRPA